VKKALAVTIISLALFVAVAVRVTGDEAPWLDTRILELVPPGNEPNSFSRVCNAFVMAGMAFVVVLVAAMAITLILLRRWRPALFWCLTFAGLFALDVALKPIFGRPSIHASGEYSFPSGNAMASMAILLGAATLMYGNPRRLYVLGGVLVAAYGGALVYLSWHYPSDVLGGWLLAVAWTGFLSLVIRPPKVFEPRRPRITRAREPRLASADAPSQLGLRGE
jgi:membrane-associated phospholipid phosphatase